MVTMGMATGTIVESGKKRKAMLRTCEHCGREFWRSLHEISRNGGKYCSLECYRAASKGRPLGRDISGAKNPNWKGGIGKDNMHWKRLFEARHPEKAAAEKAVSQAVRNGRIRRQPCEVCGATEDVHGHHDDYSKPLSVRWLCRKHHLETHRGVA